MKLRAAREASGKTQAQVAKEANVSERIYQEYEYDKSEPGVRTANRIAKAVNSTSEKLWGFGPASPDNTKEPDGNPAEWIRIKNTMKQLKNQRLIQEILWDWMKTNDNPKTAWGGEVVEISIKAEPKEIAALIAAIQERMESIDAIVSK